MSTASLVARVRKLEQAASIQAYQPQVLVWDSLNVSHEAIQVEAAALAESTDQPVFFSPKVLSEADWMAMAAKL